MRRRPAWILGLLLPCAAGCSFDTSLEGALFACTDDDGCLAGQRCGGDGVCVDAPPAVVGEGEGERPIQAGEGEGEELAEPPTIDLPGRDGLFAGEVRAVTVTGGAPPLTVEIVEGDASVVDGSVVGGQTVSRLVVQVRDAAERTARWLGWSIGDGRLWLRADEIEGVGPVRSWVDITGQAPPLAPVAGIEPPVRVAEGPRGASLRFTGGGLLEAPATAGVNGTALTIAVYGLAAPVREGELQVALSSGVTVGDGVGHRGWAVSRHRDRWVGWFAGGQPGRWSFHGPGGALRLGGWQLVVATHDGEHGGVAVDGRAPMVRPGPYTSNDEGPLRIGGDRPDGQEDAGFEGLLTEVLIWDRVLEVEERGALSAYMAAQYGTDIDGDGLDDALDSCPDDGGELDDGGREPDGDGDGVGDDCDRCPEIPDDGQDDLDGDGIGDLCDPDSDGDGLDNADEEACGSDPLDAAETAGDSDGDGVCDPLDPCPDAAEGDCPEANIAQPLGRWRFDGDLRDSSGSGRHAVADDGEAPGGVELIELVGGGGALPLGAVVRAPTLAPPRPLPTDFTLRIRLQVDDAAGGQELLRSSSDDLAIRWEDGGVRWQGLPVLAPVEAGRLTTVTFVQAGAEGRVYVDGERAGEALLEAPSAKAGDWVMGGAGARTGFIDDVTVWPTSLTDEEIWALQGRAGPPLPRPVAVIVDPEEGDAPQGIAELVSARLGAQFTIAARLTLPVNVSEAGGTLLAFLGEELPPVTTWALRLEAGHWLVDDAPLQRLGPASGGGPVQVAFVGGPQELRRYSDGVLRATARRAPLDATADRLVLGIGGEGSAAFPGQIHELRLFDRALTREQLAALRGEALHCPQGCAIDGRCHPPGARSPDLAGCGTCVPDLAPDAWTPTCDQSSVDDEFADFRQGRATDAGADLLIAANGTLFPYRSLDFDGNGWPDLVFAKSAGGTLQIYLGDEGGYDDDATLEFEAPAARRQTAADLDLDGHVDLIVTLAGEDGAPRIYWGGPDGPAGDRFDDLGMDHPEGVALGDVDRDGRLDVAVASHRRGVVQLFRGQPGRGLDAAPVGFPASTSWSVALADLDRDGALDLLAASHEEESWFFLTAGGLLQDAPPLSWSHTFEDGQIVPADVNGDGFLEVVGLDRYALTHWNLLGRQMSLAQHIELQRDATPLAVGDPDRDGRLDALARGARSAAPRFVSLRGAGEGEAFTASRGAAVMADLNGDGWVDVATSAMGAPVQSGGQVVFGGPRGFAAGRRQDLDVAGASQGWERSPGSVFDRRELYFYESRIHDAGGEATGGRLEWDAEVSESTAVALQVRAAPTRDSIGDAAWAGPGGATDGWFTDAGRLPADLDGLQFWQYRVRFTRTMPVHGPVLQQVRLSWSVVERSVRCELGERAAGLTLSDGYEHAVRLAGGGAAAVGYAGLREDGVVIAVDSQGREQWRAFPGVEGEDRLGRLCPHPDGGLLALGWSGARDDVSQPRYLRFDVDGRQVWSAGTDDGVFRRPAACIWSGDRWQVLDIYSQGDQTLAWSWVDLSDQGVRGVGRRLVGAGNAAAAPDGLRRLTGDELVALLSPFNEQFAVTPRYVRFTDAGDVLQDALIAGVDPTTYRAGRSFDRGGLLIVGSRNGFGHAVRLDGAGTALDSQSWTRGHIYSGEALGEGALLAGSDATEGQRPFRRVVGPHLIAGPHRAYPAAASTRAFAGIPRADSGALLFLRTRDVGNGDSGRLSILNTGPDGSASCP